MSAPVLSPLSSQTHKFCLLVQIGMDKIPAAWCPQNRLQLGAVVANFRWVDQGGSSEGFSDEDEEALGMQTAPPEFYDPAADGKVGASALAAAPSLAAAHRVCIGPCSLGVCDLSATAD